MLGVSGRLIGVLGISLRRIGRVMRGGLVGGGFVVACEEDDAGEDERDGECFAHGHGFAEDDPAEEDGGGRREGEGDGFDA